MEGFDIIGAALERATARAMDDRAQFRPLLVAVERFAASVGLILGGKQGLRALLAGSAPPPEDLDSFSRDYWATDRGITPLQAARGLADALWRAAPDGLGRLAHVETRVANFRFAVFAGGRIIATVTSLPGGGRETLGTPRPAQFAEGVTVLVAAPILAAIGVYATLDDFAQQARAPALLEAEAVIRPAIIAIAREELREPRPEARREDRREARREDRREDRREARGKPRHGRHGRRGGGEQPASAQYVEPQTTQVKQMWVEITRVYLTAPGRVTAGGQALIVHRHTDSKPLPPATVLTQHPFEAESATLAAIARRCGVDALCTVTDPQIPGDPRTRRLTMTIPGAAGRLTILVVYNAAAHELVAHVRLSKRVTIADERFAGILTVMRWALVEVWVARARAAKGAATPEDRRLLAVSLETYEAASQAYERALAKLAELAPSAATAATAATAAKAATDATDESAAKAATDATAASAVVAATGAPAAMAMLVDQIAPGGYQGEYEDVEVSMRREARASARQVYHASYYPARAHGAPRA